MSITNGQWRIILSVIIPALVLLASWGALRETAQTQAIDTNENAIIKIEGKMETIIIQADIYHGESSKQMDTLIGAVEALKKNE